MPVLVLERGQLVHVALPLLEGMPDLEREPGLAQSPQSLVLQSSHGVLTALDLDPGAQGETVRAGAMVHGDPGVPVRGDELHEVGMALPPTLFVASHSPASFLSTAR